MNKLHIISFDIPYPPNYGGIIDVFYKIKELHALGIEIYLHAFFTDEEKQPELEKYCAKVYYYKRGNSLISFLSFLPFRVKSRAHKEVSYNINKNKAPILFEGLHSAYVLAKDKFDDTYLRAHNIEHTYFYGLSKSEKNIFKKIFFFSEAIKLSFFEKNLSKAKGIFSISKLEQDYFLSNYGQKSTYIPAFHDATFHQHTKQKEKYLLWHGDLRVSDNIKAVLFLIEVYKNTGFNLKIASSTNPTLVLNNLKKTENIEFVKLEDNKTLDILLNNAHINVLYTYQNTGIKLKLLNALYKGKFVLGNNELLLNTGLENSCELANTKQEFIEKTKQLLNTDFTSDIIDERKKALTPFDPNNAAKKIIALIFKQ